MSIAEHVVSEVRGRVGFITLNRPLALNALSLPMIRGIYQLLRAWRTDDTIAAVALRGSSRPLDGSATHPQANPPFGAFCAGGDIRFFHEAVLASNPELGDFFTEEYTLNHLIHTYPKPTIAFLDGVVMGGGMGLCQGMTTRLVTQNTKMAMPETQIGLFPDVGGGYFLSRCPGHIGEWLALTGDVITASEAVAFGLADATLAAADLPFLWEALGTLEAVSQAAIDGLIAPLRSPKKDHLTRARALIDPPFAHNSVPEIVQALQADPSVWAQETAAKLRLRSPLMLHVTLEHLRRARGMNLADELRMERNMVHHCFSPHHLGKTALQSETLEGIRAQAIDKDRQPRWSPAAIDGVTPEMVAPFFESPWPAAAHPLKNL